MDNKLTGKRGFIVIDDPQVGEVADVAGVFMDGHPIRWEHVPDRRVRPGHAGSPPRSDIIGFDLGGHDTFGMAYVAGIGSPLVVLAQSGGQIASVMEPTHVQIAKAFTIRPEDLLFESPPCLSFSTDRIRRQAQAASDRMTAALVSGEGFPSIMDAMRAAGRAAAQFQTVVADTFARVWPMIPQPAPVSKRRRRRLRGRAKAVWRSQR